MHEVVEETSNSIPALSKAISQGALKGARGNSGVILSQLFRGFCKTISAEETIDAKMFASALRRGVDMAYKAVMKPREGTILTVSRAVADAAVAAAETEDDIVSIVDTALKAGQAMLKRTPEMLDVLKEAGVVDSGGMGYIVVFQGFQAALLGEDVSMEVENYIRESSYVEKGLDAPKLSAAASAEGEITFTYCTEFILDPLHEGVTAEDIERLRSRLAIIGDSLVLVGEETYVKVHVHTNAPGKVLQYGLRLGDLASVKVENMRQQHSNLLSLSDDSASLHKAEPSVPREPLGVVTVVSGEGIRKAFEDLGVKGFVSGGQSMNPSADDIVNAIRSVHCEDVIVLPNNSNIVLAAQQAAQLMEEECRVHVLPTKTIPQGISAALCLNPQLSAEENLITMEEAVSHVKSGQITYSIRDSVNNGLEIHEGDILGIGEGQILAAGKDLTEVFLEVLSKLYDGEDIISLYYGEGIQAEDAEQLSQAVGEAFPDCEVELCEGGQPVYYYIFSLE
jgi:DAK2 domain fusion protein YloV